MLRDIEGDNFAVRILGVNDLDHTEGIPRIGLKGYGEHGYCFVAGNFIVIGIKAVRGAFRYIIIDRNFYNSCWRK